MRENNLEVPGCFQLAIEKVNICGKLVHWYNKIWEISLKKGKTVLLFQFTLNEINFSKEISYLVRCVFLACLNVVSAKLSKFQVLFITPWNPIRLPRHQMKANLRYRKEVPRITQILQAR